MVAKAEALLKARDAEREFHGLEREFMYAYAQMVIDWERSKTVKHPRDVGNVRERILHNFFTQTGLLPRKYAIADTSVRVCSSDGFLSRELDLLFYSADNAIRLMSRGDAYEVYPVEAAFGAIQIKSRLNKGELESACENMASLRRLRKKGRPDEAPFGIIFAYDTDLSWSQLVEQIRLQTFSLPTRELPNAIIILTRGFFMFGDGRTAAIFTDMVPSDGAQRKIHGYPNRDNLVLYTLYTFVLELLQRSTELTIPISSYFSLPATAGQLSYQFSLGVFGELGSCTTHGPFARRIAEGHLRKVVEYCRAKGPVSFAEALDQAYERALCGETEVWGMPNQVSIYNPSEHPYSRILVADSDFVNLEGKTVTVKALAFDTILCQGMTILIPHYYNCTEGIIGDCPKCAKLRNKS